MSADPSKTRLVKEWKTLDEPVTKLGNYSTTPWLVLGCRFDPTGRFLFAGAQENRVYRWELASGNKTTLEGHESWVRALAFHPRGSWLVSADYAGRVIVWPYAEERPKPQRSFEGHRGSVRAVAVSPDGRCFASAGNDRVVRLWSAPDGQLKLEMTGHASHIYSLAFHPDGTSLVSADLKGAVKHWDTATGKLVRELDAGLLWKYDQKYMHDVGGIRTLAFRADGQLLACTGESQVVDAIKGGQPTVVLLDWKSGKQQQRLGPAQETSAVAWGAAFHPQGFLVAAGGSRTFGGLWFWKPDAARAFHTLRSKPNGPGFDMDLHPDGVQLAVADWDATVRLYEMGAGPSQPGR